MLTSDAGPASAQQWRDGARKQDESWWEDWARWMADRAGPLAKPPRIGSRRHRVLADGPGEYVYG